MARILLVDDDILTLEVTKIELEDKGHIVSTVSSGEEGLRRVEQESFDLVITDLIMPDKEGMEVLLTIKRANPAQKVIVMSGGGSQEPGTYLHMAEKLGANAILAKPFSAVELMRVMNPVLAA